MMSTTGTCEAWEATAIIQSISVFPGWENKMVSNQQGRCRPYELTGLECHTKYLPYWAKGIFVSRDSFF